MGQISISANGRRLLIEGNIESYVAGYDDWNADTSSIAQLSSQIPHGSTCIDVGANIGVISVALAVQRPDCHIIAIEPVPDNFNCLQRNIEANGIKNIEAVNAAVGDKPGVIRMLNQGPWSRFDASGEIETPVIQLDDFAERNVGFVKIDVEGYEPFVIAGGRKLFLERRPLVHMELNTYTMLIKHLDPIAFCQAIWNSSEIIDAFYHEHRVTLPKTPEAWVHDNITAYESVSDIVFRPSKPFPRLDEMINSPQYVELKRMRAVKAALWMRKKMMRG